MALIIQLLITGLLLGIIYAMISLGLSIIWGVTRIINIAHGELIILGAYATYFMYKNLGGDPFLYLPITGLLVGVVGLIIQYTLYNRILGKEELITLILAFGVSIVLSTLMLIFFTGDFRFLSTNYTSETFEILGYQMKTGDIFGAIISLSVIFGTYFLLEKTNTGRAIRAVAQDREAAILMGVDVKQIYIIAMFLSSFIAGVSGGLVAILYTFTPSSGGSYLGWSFAVTVLAGLGSIQGIVIAGIIIGVARAVTSYQFSGLESSIGFLIMIAVLLVRPRGLFGRSDE